MATTATAQFNKHFSEVPSELFGKGGSCFLRNGKRFTASKILTAGLLFTRAAVLGDGCTTSYTDFENELSYAHATTARNVAELTRDGIFNRNGQSKYTAAYSVDTKHGVPVYHFLRTETFNGKHLTGNAVLELCVMICFYTNSEREQKYFIGGEKRVAKTLNVADSTAHGIIKELMQAECVSRFVMHDGKLSEGKGINNDYKTVYVVSDTILKKVKAIRKEIGRQKAQTETLKKLFSEKPEPKPAAGSEPRRKPNLLTEYQETLSTVQANAEKLAATLAVRFRDDFAFNKLKLDYINALDKYFAALRQSNGQGAELEARQIDCILSDVLNYLQAHNVQRKDLPDDWRAFIKDLLRQ